MDETAMCWWPASISQWLTKSGSLSQLRHVKKLVLDLSGWSSNAPSVCDLLTEVWALPSLQNLELRLDRIPLSVAGLLRTLGCAEA